MFDASKIAFSRAGRFLTLSRMEGALWLRSVRGGDLRPSLGRLCRIGFAGSDGPVEPMLTLAPDCLRAEAGEAWAEFAIGEGERLQLRGHGLRLEFALLGSRYDYAYRMPSGENSVVAAYENTRMIPRARCGDLQVSGQWRRDHSEDVTISFSGAEGFEGTIDLFAAVAPPAAEADFNHARADAAAEFAEWQARAPETGRDPESRRFAAYVLWANQVPPEGQLTRPAIYMSKNHMINIWSWDNAFSALGVSGIDAALAFDQFAAIFDHQHASGLLPDFINDRDVSFAFTKPPVHGWALLRIVAQDPGFLTPDRRSYFRAHIAAQVRYWLHETRADAIALPAYCHGNDSGWDNASFFAEGGPVQSPDLACFLILACEALAMLAETAAEKALWRGEADVLTALLLKDLWSGETFGTRRMDTPETLTLGQSLIQFIPLILGDRLPRPMAKALVERLTSGGYLTRWGPATENTRSPFYEADGYWRGPIWAPTTCLLVDGLLAQGETTLADDLTARFCTLCETSGMAENFDALSGAGLRDHGFAWTAAVYLWLASGLHSGDQRQEANA